LYILRHVVDVYKSSGAGVGAWCKGNSTPVRCPVVDEEMMRLGHWLGLVFWISFSAVQVIGEKKDVYPIRTLFPLADLG